MRERKLQRASLSVASSLLHATNEKTVYLPSHSHANYQTRPVPHADQVVPCMCCTVYSQLTCPLSNPDNLFGIGLLHYPDNLFGIGLLHYHNNEGDHTRMIILGYRLQCLPAVFDSAAMYSAYVAVRSCVYT